MLWCFTTHISGSSKITGRSGQKDSMTKREYSNVLPSIIRPLSLFLCWNLSDSCSCSRSHTPPNSQQGSSLTLRNPVSCADSGKKKERFLAWWVCPKFIISLPSEIWRVSEVHPGALRKKPLLIIINYLPPSHTSEQLHLSKPPLTWKQHMKI